MISDHGLMGGAPEGTSKMLTMKHIHLRVRHGAQLNTLKVILFLINKLGIIELGLKAAYFKKIIRRIKRVLGLSRK